MLQILKKHVKQFTNTERDVTSYVHFIDDGSVVVTDAHKLVKVLDVHTEAAHMRKTDCKTVVTTPLEKPVPDFNRLFPNGAPQHEIEVNVAETLSYCQAVEAMMNASDAPSEPIKLVGTTEGLVLRGTAYVSEQWRGRGEAIVYLSKMQFDDLEMTFNLEYFIQCLTLLKAFRYEFVTLALYGRTKPMTFQTIDESVEMLLLPVRTY